MLAAWVSAPFLGINVKADGTPVVDVKTATLTSPSGTTNPHGNATWELYQSGNRELEIEVEDLSLAEGTSLVIVIDNNIAGTAPVDNRGRAKLKLRTEHGEPVPPVNDGSMVDVLNGSTVLVHGVFGNGNTTPSPTSTPSVTPSGTPSGTPSVTPSGTPSGTPSNTPSPSPTGTATGTPSPSPTGTPMIVRSAILRAPGGTVNPHGAAVWQFYSNGNREIEIELEDISLAIGTVLDFVVDGSVIGQAPVDDRNRAKLKLRTENGQTVPVVNDGSTVEVRNGGTILANGVFGGGPTPTVTPTGTPSGTPSVTPSGTPSGTPSNTPSPSPTGTGTGTPSPSPTGTPMIVRSAILRAPAGTVNPHGHAEWQLYGNGNREIEIEVEDLSLAMGTVLDFVVDGNVIGQAAVDDRNKAKLKLRTENGQVVPFVNDGSTVEVRNAGSVLVNGVFGAGPTPSVTPTGTPSGTPSVSPTGTPSGTPSQTPTGTPSGTPSVTPTGTPHNENELFAALTGSTINGVLPIGFAEYEVHSSRTELEVTVRQVNLAAGTSLSVIVDGTPVGNIVLQNGEGRLRLRSDNGQTVPVVMAGSAISVNDSSSAILAGTFGSMGTPTPSPTGTPGGTPSPTPFGRSFEAHLDGSQMDPPVSTAGRGEIKVVLTANETQATVFGEFHNLTSSETGARIETTGVTPETIVDLGVVGGTNGRFAPVSVPVTAAQVQQLRAGMWSAVITTVNNPAGEIRGGFRNHSRHSDFDGDGSHDFALFRPSTATWFIQNTSGFSAIAYGSPSDKLVSGDYDGDGRSDAAVYRDANGLGVWDIQRSSDGGSTAVQFGLTSDIAVRADLDGDGRLDLVVYRASQGIWYIRESSGSADRTVRFGVAEDIPIPMDMDGDGRDDIAVYRPSLGMWFWTVGSTTARFGAANFGTSTDTPVKGDFDGDGRADITVYRPSNGVWYTLRSSDGQVRAVQFGSATDIPVAGNYDGDGQTDIAVFRPSTGNWYILRSSDGQVQSAHFGTSGDIPAIAR